jgi:hypothetical protein
MGVGGRGKCPGAPSHHLKEGEDRQNGIGKRKNRRPKRYRKSRMAKNGNGIKKKKKMYTHTQRTNIHPLREGDEASVFLVVDKEAIKGNIIINKIGETHRGLRKDGWRKEP